MSDAWSQVASMSRRASDLREVCTPRNVGGVVLTHRQLQLLNYLSSGLSNKEIANELGLVESTIKNNLSPLYRCIGVRDRTQAVIWAQDNLVPDEPIDGEAELQAVLEGRVIIVSPAQLQLLDCLRRGLSSKEIAVEVGRAESTVKNNLGSLFSLLGVRDRMQAVILARQLGTRIRVARPKTEKLTESELQIIEAILAGHTNQEIATELGVDIRELLIQIFSLLEVAEEINLAGLVVAAIRRNNPCSHQEQQVPTSFGREKTT